MSVKRTLLPVLVATALAVGLSFSFHGSASGTVGAKPITFTKDVAPIFYKSCAECHRPGESAPFSVLAYKDARPWAKSIREQVVKRQMPPWHADPHVGQWANDRRLTQAEVETIAAWVDQGAKEGDAKDLPPAPKFAEGWAIGQPDVVLSMPEEYTVAANGPDEYQYFDIPTNFTEDKYVQMAEARPGNRKVVHHILAFLVPPGAPNMSKLPKEMRDKAVELSLRTTPFYRDGYLIRVKPDAPIFQDAGDVPKNQQQHNGGADNQLAAYAPGLNPDVWEPGTVKKVPAGASIRLQVHYSKVAGAEIKDRSVVGLVFAKQPPQKFVSTRRIGNGFFQIPAGAEHHQVTAAWTPSFDLTLYTLMPHMHYRGAAMEYKVTYPDGKSEVLLNVPSYSFSWQTAYYLKQPKRIPKGSRIVVTGWFDNSAKNKFNPDPTKTVRYGEPTYDEMMIGYVNYVADWPTLAKVDPKMLDSYAGRYQAALNRFYVVTREGDKLYGQLAGGIRRELRPSSETTFFVPEVEATVTFVKNEQGEPVEVIYEREDLIRAKKVKDVATADAK